MRGHFAMAMTIFSPLQVSLKCNPFWSRINKQESPPQGLIYFTCKINEILYELDVKGV